MGEIYKSKTEDLEEKNTILEIKIHWVGLI